MNKLSTLLFDDSFIYRAYYIVFPFVMFYIWFGYFPMPRGVYKDLNGVVYQVMKNDDFYRAYSFSSREKEISFQPVELTPWENSAASAQAALNMLAKKEHLSFYGFNIFIPTL